MLNETDMKNLTVISIGGKDYLGVVKKVADHIGIEDAMGLNDGFTPKSMKGYIKYKNLGKLKSLTFRGETTFIERKMTAEEVTDFVYLDKLFEQAKTNAIKNLENAAFDAACPVGSK